MANRKNDEDFQEKENGDRWLLTYSDLITLLLALFIIMYAMSTINVQKFEQLSESLGSALHNTPPAQKAAKPPAENNQAAPKDISQAEQLLEDKKNLDELYNYINKYIKEKDLGGSVSVKETNNAVVLHLKDTIIFYPDTAELRSESYQVLQMLSIVIADIYGVVDHITITGNTADIGSRTAEGEAGAWQLSVDRAVRVLNTLVDDGIPADKLSIEGNSHYKPIAPNDTQEGRAQNRRVEISIFRSK